MVVESRLSEDGFSNGVNVICGLDFEIEELMIEKFLKIRFSFSYWDFLTLTTSSYKSLSI